MDRVGYVYYNNEYSGKVTESEKGFKFTYDSDYIITGAPIGFNYPLTQTSYFSKTLFPLFENLICEGWLLDLQCRSQHIDKQDKFGILLKNGKDLAGAITVLGEVI